MPILVINLERDADRMAECREAFAGAHQFALQRSPGVIPAIPQTAQSFLARGRKVQGGTLGVFMAHVLAWETIAELSGPALVVEDDVKPAGLGRVLSVDLPRDLDVLHVNHRMADPHTERGELAIVPAWTVFEHKLKLPPPKAAPGGDGYFVTPAGARKLLRAVARDGFDGHVDWRLLRYGCERATVERVGAGTWLPEHRTMRDDDDAPLWSVVRSYRSTHPLVRMRGMAESSRKSVSGLEQRPEVAGSNV